MKPLTDSGAANTPVSFDSDTWAQYRRPPWAFARMVSLAVCGMTLCALVYAWLSPMDIVVSAQGRVIPSGRSKVVQPLDAGVVKKIMVRDGQAVKAGDVLIELDTTASLSDRDRTQREIWEAEADVARLQALLSGSSHAVMPPGLPTEVVASEMALLASKGSEQQLRMAALDADVARREADRDAIAASIAQLANSLPLMRQKLEMREDLARTGHIARAGVIDSRLELISMEKEQSVQGNRLKEAAAGLRAADQQRAQAQAEFRARSNAELAEAIRKRAAARQDFVKAAQRTELQVLRSPIDGVVQQLAVTTVGGVVTQAQALATIVPDGAALEVEAQVLNKDVGHVRVGQRVINKVETFDFTRYGYIEGKVQWVGTDAINDPKLGPVYPVRIRLARTETPTAVNGRTGLIGAGMSVTADIRTGERRMLEYFLAPLMRQGHEALRER